jgi:hypothetical protein
MLADDFQFWEERIAVLGEVIQETQEMAQSMDSSADLKTLKLKAPQKGESENERSIADALDHEAGVISATGLALKNLNKFSKSSLNYFLNGFYKTPRCLERAKDFPAPMVLNTLVTEISRDLEIFQRSIQQRKLIAGKVSKQLLLLSVGDRVAAAALQPAFDAKFLKRGVVTTHLGDDFEIRLIPYSEMLMIEMPFTTGTVLAEKTSRLFPNHEHLALLHEVGHHVYHFGIVPGKQFTFESFLTQELFNQGITGGLANWLEEIFADSYGLMVGGPVMALAYQERLSQESPDALSQDSGDHPISILRPLIQTQVLRLIMDTGGAGSELYQNSPDALDANWLKFLQNKDPRKEIFHPQGVSQPVSGAVIVQGLVPIIRKILDSLENLRSFASSSAWSKDLVAGQGLSSLDDQFQQVGFLKSVKIPEFSTIDGTEDLIAKFIPKSGHSLTPSQWMPLFSFAGWSTAYSVGDMPRATVGTLRVGDIPSK